jgi:glutamate racemase
MPEVGYIRGLYTPPMIGRVEEKKVGEFHPPQAIGIFDSGVGGLTVMSEVMQQLLHEDVVYIADSAHVPYGSHSKDEIIKFNRAIFEHFMKFKVKIVLMACGTSSSLAFEEMQRAYKVPIVDTVGPGTRAALSASASGRIGVIATEATIRSGAFQTRLLSVRGGIEVYSQACPLFVPLIEGGFIDTPETRAIAGQYLKPLLEARIDTLILGCTHYPHLAKTLKEIVGEGVILIDPAQAMVDEAKKSMKKMNLFKETPKPPYYRYLVTGSPTQFAELGGRLLGKPILNVQKVTL